jgi:hypothetical protein
MDSHPFLVKREVISGLPFDCRVVNSAIIPTTSTVGIEALPGLSLKRKSTENKS